MVLRNSPSRMARSNNNRAFKSLVDLFLAAILSSGCLWSAQQNALAADKQLEGEIARALRSTLNCKNIDVRIFSNAQKPNKIERLAIKMDGVELGQLEADHMTVVYNSPVIDLKRLKRENVLVVSSSSKFKVSILASVKALEKYLMKKANQFNKKNVHISLKFTPPYIECLYDVPVHEIAPESVDLLKTFVRGGKVEGYAAFKIEARNNALYASSSKVITNHFLLPNALLRMFQSKFNPFDEIAVVGPFQYTINNVSVQSSYVLLSN